MDKKVYNQTYIGDDLCGKCIHLFLNNGEIGNGCRAFPEEIPLDVKHGHNHHSVIPGQTGDYTYKEASYEELSPFGRYLYAKKENSR